MTHSAPRGRLGGQVLTGEDRRRSQRVILRVGVTLKIVVAGKTVVATGNTVSVNDTGAMVLCVRSFSPESTMEIQNDRTGEKMPCRVTRSSVESTDGYLIPIEFATPAPTFWRISFPPRDWKPGDE